MLCEIKIQGIIPTALSILFKKPANSLFNFFKSFIDGLRMRDRS